MKATFTAKSMKPKQQVHEAEATRTRTLQNDSSRESERARDFVLEYDTRSSSDDCCSWSLSWFEGTPEAF